MIRHVRLQEVEQPNYALKPDVLENTRQYLEIRSEGAAPNASQAAAWDCFYRTCHPLVLRGVRKACLSDPDRADCIQEVWLNIIRSLKKRQYSPDGGQFCHWLSRLIRNRVIDYVRSANGVQLIHHPNMDDLKNPHATAPQETVERREAEELIREVLRLLEARTSATNCRIIHGMWIRGDAVSEIADELGLAPRQVWYRHRRTKVRLKRLFELHGLGTESEAKST